MISLFSLYIRNWWDGIGLVLLRGVDLSVCSLHHVGWAFWCVRAGWISVFLSFHLRKRVYRRRDVYRRVDGMNVES